MSCLLRQPHVRHYIICISRSMRFTMEGARGHEALRGKTNVNRKNVVGEGHMELYITPAATSTFEKMVHVGRT